MIQADYFNFLFYEKFTWTFNTYFNTTEWIAKLFLIFQVIYYMKYSIIGILFFFSLALAFYLTIIKQVDDETRFPYRAKIVFDRIDGLKQGTEVSIKGITAGKVYDIIVVSRKNLKNIPNYSPEKEELIELTLALDRPLSLWKNYSVEFKKATAFSGRSIDIDPGGQNNFIENTYIPNPRKKDLNMTMRYYDDFFAGSARLIRENKPELRKTVSNLKSISSKLNKGKGTLGELINSDKTYVSLSETTNDIKILAKEGRWYAESIRHDDVSSVPFFITTIVNILGINLIF